MNVQAFSPELGRTPVRSLVKCSCPGYAKCLNFRVCKHAGAFLIMGANRKPGKEEREWNYLNDSRVTIRHLREGRRDVITPPIPPEETAAVAGAVVDLQPGGSIPDPGTAAGAGRTLPAPPAGELYYPMITLAAREEEELIRQGRLVQVAAAASSSTSIFDNYEIGAEMP